LLVTSNPVFQRLEQHGMTADATIDYDGLQQEALRGLVRNVLVRVAKSGLPGDHHLYISFDVRAPGVVLSKRLREKYPHEMTIVLQHRFWDLSIQDERFEVKLTFDGIPERLVVPFAAIKVFLDPSVRFVLHFEEAASEAAADGQETDGGDARPNGIRTATSRKPRAPRPKSRTDRDVGSGTQLSAVPDEAPPQQLGKPSAAPVQNLSKSRSPTPALSSVPPADADPKPQLAEGEKPAGSAQVVSLDAFRKK
jgi:uncharacterized protein